MKFGAGFFEGKYTRQILAGFITYFFLLVATATLAVAADPRPGDSCSSAKAYGGDPYFGGTWSSSDIETYSASGGCPGAPQTYSCQSGQSRTINWQLKCGCDYNSATGKYSCYWRMDYCRVTKISAYCLRQGMTCPGDSCGTQSGSRAVQNRNREDYNSCLDFEIATIFPPRRGGSTAVLEARKQPSRRARARQIRTREKLRNRIASAARLIDLGESVHSEPPKECVREE